MSYYTARYAYYWVLLTLNIMLILLQRPFRAKSNEDLQKAIISDRIEFPKDPKVSPNGIQFIKELLTRDISKRIGVGESGFKRLKSHPWMKGVCWDILSTKAVGAPFVPDVNTLRGFV